MTITNWRTFCTVLMLLGMFAGTYGEERASPTELPSDIQDPAFDSIVNVRLIGQAIEEQDASKLTDAVMLLAHGEKLLGRKHYSGLDAGSLASSALQLASQQRDVAALKRLQRFGDSHNLETLAKNASNHFNTIRLLGEGERSLDPVVADVTRLSFDSYLAYQVALEQIEVSRRTGDSDALDRLEKWLPEADSWFAKPQVDELNTRLDKARTQISNDNANPILQQLMAVSRADKAADKYKEYSAMAQAQASLITAQAGAAKTQAEVAKMRTEVLSNLEDLKQKKFVTKEKRAALFWALKQQYQQNKPKRTVTSESAARIARNSAPQRVNLAEIRWPALFNRHPFTFAKARYEKLIATRTTQNSGIGSDCHTQICQLSGRVESVLAEHIKSMTPAEYVHAKKLVRAIVHSSSFPVEDSSYVAAADSLKAQPQATGVSLANTAAASSQTVPLHSTPPATFTLYRALHEDIEEAAAYGDSDSLKALKELTGSVPLLSSEQRELLVKKIDQSPDKEAGTQPNPLENTLAALAPIAGMEPAPWPAASGKSIDQESQSKAYIALMNAYATMALN